MPSGLSTYYCAVRSSDLTINKFTTLDLCCSEVETFEILSIEKTNYNKFMIWFDIGELELRLKNGDLSDKDSFYYLLANLVLFSIVPYIESNDYTNKWLIALEIAVLIAMTVIGTKRTFDINSAGDNKDYLKRFLSLSFVTGIRLLVLVCIAAIPVGTIVYLLDKSIRAIENIDNLFDIAVTVVANLVYYFMLTKSFKRVSQ